MRYSMRFSLTDYFRGIIHEFYYVVYCTLNSIFVIYNINVAQIQFKMFKLIQLKPQHNSILEIKTGLLL